FRVAPLRAFAQREQGFLAAETLTPAGDVEHIVGCQVVGRRIAWMLDEDAVAAGVATHIGEGDENLAGVSDLPSPVLVADFTGPLTQARKSGFADAVCRVDVFDRDHDA